MKHYPLLLIPFALAACTSAPTTTGDVAPSALPSQLKAYHWQLTEAVDDAGQHDDALFARQLQFDFRDQNLSITGGCNLMGGGYRLSGDNLQIGMLRQTMMACPDEALMTQDQAVSAYLEHDLALALTQGETPQLTLTSENGARLVFDGSPTAETRYGGKGETVFLEVAAQREECSHPLIPDMRCLKVRELRYDEQGLRTGAGEWQPLYSEIEGYTHQPGVRNVLRLKRYAIDNPPADAPSEAYVLDMVVESENVSPQ